jgi:DNA-3-methyladenine glycosylase
MLNAVTGPPGFPSAVLVRGAGDTFGPGRVTKRLHIDKAQHERPVAETSGLWIEDDGIVAPEHEVLRTPRIGVDYAGPDWAGRPYRLVWQRPAKRAE